MSNADPANPVGSQLDEDRKKLVARLPSVNQAKLRYVLGEEVADANRQQTFDLAMMVLLYSDLFESDTVDAAQAAFMNVFGITDPAAPLAMQFMVRSDDPAVGCELANLIASTPGVAAVEHVRITDSGVEKSQH